MIFSIFFDPKTQEMEYTCNEEGVTFDIVIALLQKAAIKKGVNDKVEKMMAEERAKQKEGKNKKKNK